jgi:DUF1680 family protein
MTRRELLTRAGCGAVAAFAGAISFDSTARASGPAPPRQAAGRVSPVALRDVRLLEGPFRQAQQRDLAYLLSLDPDRLLHNFHVNAGLTPKAPVYGGWESEEPWVGIRCQGHTLGHYLSAVSLMYASTGDPRMKDRVDYIVDELRACQQASGTGLVCAFPDGPAQLDAAIAGRRIVGVPWYTMHKIFAGLRDAHLDGGSRVAREVLTKLADWAVTATSPMSDAEMQHKLRVEHGGMNEVLAVVFAITGARKYLAAARRFSHEVLLAPLAELRDTLDGLHANTQIPKVIGFQRLFELTGEDRYAAASTFFWRSVIERRSFVTGGHGDNEHFFPPAKFVEHLPSAKTMETCGTHNMLRLTRLLFQTAPSATYADFYERALYNGILASQDPESGMMTYFQATRPGYIRLFHTPDRSFWCCTGTGIENHAKYGDSIYFEDAAGVWMNLYIPSTVTSKASGLSLRQTTTFPDEPRTRLDITSDRPVRAAIRVRRPGWCPDMRMRVNGHLTPERAGSDGYVVIDREWRRGDRVDVDLPMRLRAEALPGAPDHVAFVYGPIVLAGRLGREGLSPGSQIIVNERESGTKLNAAVDVPALAGDAASLVDHVQRDARDPLVFRTVGVGRPRDVELAPYYRLAHERYNLYWRVAGA